MRSDRLLLFLALTGCQSSPLSQDWTKLTQSEREDALQGITARCRLPANRLQILEGNGVRVMPDANDSYEAVDCMLRELKNLHGADLGFVGNEAYIDEGSE